MKSEIGKKKSEVGSWIVSLLGFRKRQQVWLYFVYFEEATELVLFFVMALKGRTLCLVVVE